MPGRMTTPDTSEVMATITDDRLDSQMNGSGLNGQSGDNSCQSVNSEDCSNQDSPNTDKNTFKGLLKQPLDGFEIVHRNGKEKNGVNGVKTTENGTENGDSCDSLSREEMDVDESNNIPSEHGEDSRDSRSSLDVHESGETRADEEEQESGNPDKKDSKEDSKVDNLSDNDMDVSTASNKDLQDNPCDETTGKDEKEDSRDETTNENGKDDSRDETTSKDGKDDSRNETTSKDEKDSLKMSDSVQEDTKESDQTELKNKERNEEIEKVKVDESTGEANVIDLDMKIEGEKENKQNTSNKNDTIATKLPDSKSGTTKEQAKEITPSTSDKGPQGDSKKKLRPSRVDKLLDSDKSSGGITGSENLRPFARLLFDLGLDLSRQQVYKDLVKVQKKKLSRNKLNEKESAQLEKLNEAYSHLIDKNKPYTLPKHKCNTCKFRSDTLNSLELHKEYEHAGNCGLCGYQTRNLFAFQYHMEAEHNRQGRIQPTLGMYICPYCPYEHHTSKKNFLKHLQKCEQNFKLNRNLQPVPADCDIPLKAPPVPVKSAIRAPPPLQRKPEARPLVPAVRPVVQTAKAGVHYNVRQPTAQANQHPVTITPQMIQSATAMPWSNIKENQGPQLVQMGNQYFMVVNQNGQLFMTPMAGAQGQPGTTTASGAAPTTSSAAVPISTRPSPKQATRPGPASSKTRPGPASKTQVPVVTKGSQSSQQNQFEVCEICGGFVKDRDALRVHFFWAHKIEIHPAVMKEKNAALKCQHCVQRFWTYQGYKRHSQAAHPGAAEQKGITCYVCAMFVPDFITHMTSKHPQVVKRMLGQIRCVVCQDAFPSETALESHMLVDHKDVVTQYGSIGSMNKSSSPAKPASKTSDKASPIPTGLYQNASSTQATKCSRCSFMFTSPAVYKVHFTKSHSKQKEPCLLCDEEIIVGSPFIKHAQDEHLKTAKVKVSRLTEEQVQKYLVEAKSEVSRKRKNSEEVIVIDLDNPPKKVCREGTTAEEEEVMEIDEANEVSNHKSPEANKDLNKDQAEKENIQVLEIKDDNEGDDDNNSDAGDEVEKESASGSVLEIEDDDKDDQDERPASDGEKDGEKDEDSDGEKDEDVEEDMAEVVSDQSSSEKNSPKKFIEEVMEVDGETVVVQKLADD